MSIVRDTVVLNKAFSAAFVKSYESAEDPMDVMDLILRTQSSSNKEDYGWLGDIPEMSEWVDERQLKGLKDYQYELVNKDYEATLKVHANEIDDDQLGNVKVRINDMAVKARKFPRKLFFNALSAGTTDLCYDGQPFFDTAHPESGSNQSNLLQYTKAGSLPTVAELKTAFEAAESAMLGFQNDQGDYINEGEALQLKVVCHPVLKSRFRELFNSQLINNTTNVLQGAASLVSSSRIGTSTDWYLFNMGGTIKPFIWQERQAVRFLPQEENSDRGFMRKEHLYGVDARYGFGYGLWHKAIKNYI